MASEKIPCIKCNNPARKFGKDKLGNQRHHCDTCGATFILQKKEIRLDRAKVIRCLKLLVEGVSIRSIERLEDVNKETILHLLNVAGRRCIQVIQQYIVDVPVELIEADEVWAFVAKKQGHLTEEEREQGEKGDAYTFVAIEAKSKLVLCYHLGKRDLPNAMQFMEKLQKATDGRFQLTTDGLKAYLGAVEETFGADIDYAQLIKHYLSDETGNLDRRYSPGDFVGATKQTITGKPNMEKVSTSYVERNNLTIRMSTRRLTRLTNAFSKKWANLDMALAINFAHYNFCKVHGSLRVTPCMEAGITPHVWTWDELLGADFGLTRQGDDSPQQSA